MNRWYSYLHRRTMDFTSTPAGNTLAIGCVVLKVPLPYQHPWGCSSLSTPNWLCHPEHPPTMKMEKSQFGLASMHVLVVLQMIPPLLPVNCPIPLLRMCHKCIERLTEYTSHTQHMHHSIHYHLTLHMQVHYSSDQSILNTTESSLCSDRIEILCELYCCFYCVHLLPCKSFPPLVHPIRES